MRISVTQLDSLLAQSLKPLYLLYGNEPLQLTEAADAIRNACRRHGIEERQVFSVLPGFDWNDLAAEFEAMPLFASRRLLDVRVPEGKLGSEGTSVLTRFAESPPPDTVLLLVLENAPATVTKSRWFQKLETIGLAVQARTLHGRDLVAWLQRRAKSRGLHLDTEALRLLAQRTEGNLLAAAQEIDKLYVLFGEMVVGAEELARAVADNARFDVFDLMEALLLGQVRRADRIVAGLAAEGVAPAVVLWAITRELRLLAQLLDDRRRGVPLAESCRRLKLWERRKLQVERALARLQVADVYQALAVAVHLDAVIKGQTDGDPWEGLRGLCLGLASGDSRLIVMRETGET